MGLYWSGDEDCQACPREGSPDFIALCGIDLPEGTVPNAETRQPEDVNECALLKGGK